MTIGKWRGGKWQLESGKASSGKVRGVGRRRGERRQVARKIASGNLCSRHTLRLKGIADTVEYRLLE